MSKNFTSRFGADLESMIRLKVSVGGAESTYLDRARNFDRFCAEQYPEADRLTEPVGIELDQGRWNGNERDFIQACF